MLEQVRELLLQKYNQKIEEYNAIKTQVIELEDRILNDDGENIYKQEMKRLKKSGLKKNSEEYQKELERIENEYKQGLLSFKQNHEKYTDLRREASLIDIYGYKRKMTRVENAKELKDLKLDEEKAAKILSGELEDIM